MDIGSVLQTGVNGMRRSQSEILKSADEIVRAGTVERDDSTIVDIVEPLINLKIEQQLFDASAKIVQTADSLLGTILDIKT